MPYFYITLLLFILGTFGTVYGVSEDIPPPDTNPSNITFSEVAITSSTYPATEISEPISPEEFPEPKEVGSVHDEKEPEKIERTNIQVSTADAYDSPDVPFYSQFTDITSPNWKKIGCGVASLAMLIEHHNPGKVEVDTLLTEGIKANAYLNNAGWTYAGLIGISKKYGLNGASYDLGGSSMEAAFLRLETALEKGPVMVSVHYTFDPTNPIPHLAIATGIHDGVFYYNDPAEESGGGSIPVAQFKSSWKKRYIEFYPAT